MSAPPLPSIVSAPVPPVRVLAADEPVIVTLVASRVASTLAIFVTVTVSPVVWSALARLTMTPVFSARVLEPVPPSIDASVPL